MNILLVGGPGSLINNLIIKLNKEGHRIYLLTGSKYKQAAYQKVFERYNFSYDSPCLNEIFESVSPDVTVYMGAYDSNYAWQEEEEEEHNATRYVSGLTNLLMAYARKRESKFIYLSSHEVYTGQYDENIIEGEPLTPVTHKSMALAMAENLCEDYRRYKLKNIITVRMDHLYSIPKRKKDIDNICAEFCLEALQKKTISIVEGNIFSMIYETDAVEYINRLIMAEAHHCPVYNLTSPVAISEYDIAKMVSRAVTGVTEEQEENGEEVESIDIIAKPEAGERRVLSNQLYDNEFGMPFCCEINTIIERMVAQIKKRSHAFFRGEKSDEPLWKRILEKTGWFIKASIPYVENILAFFLFFFLDGYIQEGSIFYRLDFFLIYVLLFAIFYGQQQGLLAAVLAVFGYCITRVSFENGFDIMLTSDTYIWIAQLFVFGLVVGYMKDQLSEIERENEEEQEYLAEQLTDITDIHTSNVRVKDALETQIVNQSDSVGKIYSITSSLNQYSAEEVLFYAAETVAKLMRTKDVAIYSVSNADFARLVSYTSPKAKVLGNSIRYPGMEELYETIAEGKVYINRQMDDRYPLMAYAIFENEKMQMLIFVWGLSWEQMTLGQSNQLTIVGSLIQNAVLRANKYMDALEHQRYVADSRMLVPEAFATLVNAHLQAGDKGLTECTLLRILSSVNEGDRIADGKLLVSKLRLSDYVGTLSDGNLYVLLTNTTNKDADFVIQRFAALGFETEVVREKIT